MSGDQQAEVIMGRTAHRREGGARGVLQAGDLVKTFGKRQVVKRVSLEISKGEIVGLLGPNGAGKTTTFHMIAGMIRPDGGTVILNNADITRHPMYRRARLGIGYLSQEASIFRHLTVKQNLMAILETLPLSKGQTRERMEKLLGEFGIDHLSGRMAYTLSGGERRRLEIARALVRDPQFLLLDEPFAGVDPIAVEEIQRIMSGFRDRGIGVLITDHNVHETLSITDRAYLLYEGTVLKSGSAEVLANDPEARKLYLGTKFRLDR